jgi:hypothetical protein
MNRIIYIISIVSLIALSGIVAFWSSSPSRLTGNPIGGAGVMEIPAQPTACDVQALESLSGPTPSKGENLPSPGICQDDWVSGWEVPVYNCEILFGPV